MVSSFSFYSTCCSLQPSHLTSKGSEPKVLHSWPRKGVAVELLPRPTVASSGARLLRPSEAPHP